MAMLSFRSLSVCVLTLWASTVFAQAWPSKPIRWIVPFAPAGANDITARLAAERLTRALGQPVVVENRAGAAGTIGIELVAKAPPDGYTIVSSSDTIASAPHLYSKIGFQPLKDFIPVTQLARQPVVLAAHPSLGVNSVAELVALAKTKPGLGYATSGAGTQQHIAAEWFASLAGIKLTHVPYKGGGQAITDFIGGQVPLACGRRVKELDRSLVAGSINSSHKVLHDTGVVCDAHATDGQPERGAGGDREGARARVEHDAVDLGIGRDGKRGYIG